jgi:uncharacterized protein (UPF0264 family)
MIKLLISVRDRDEAAAALAGGADIIDAKDPDRGALGPVELPTFREIVACVDARVPVTAALGEAHDEDVMCLRARAFAAAGAAFVKIGFAGITDRVRVSALLQAARNAVGLISHVVPVAYADFGDVDALDPSALIDIAAAAGTRAVLLDTANKSGPGLRRLMSEATLRSWIRRGHAAGLIAAVAGKLSVDDLLFARHAGADIVGVRGAACENGRTSRVTGERVLRLRATLADDTHATIARDAASPLFVSN